MENKEYLYKPKKLILLNEHLKNIAEKRSLFYKLKKKIFKKEEPFRVG